MMKSKHGKVALFVAGMFVMSQALIGSAFAQDDNGNNDNNNGNSTTVEVGTTNGGSDTTAATTTTTETTVVKTTTKDETVWTGHFSNVTANRSGVTDEYCKARVPDNFKTDSKMVMKEIHADNGVDAKDLGYRTRAVGGVYFLDGTASFTVTVDGKESKQKAHYFGQTLQREGGVQRGVWFTKDCKGFYAVGPSE